MRICVAGERSRAGPPVAAPIPRTTVTMRTRFTSAVLLTRRYVRKHSNEQRIQARFLRVPIIAWDCVGPLGSALPSFHLVLLLDKIVPLVIPTKRGIGQSMEIKAGWLQEAIRSC